MHAHPRSASLPYPDTALLLVADDEPPIRRLLTRALEEIGHRVVAARDGEEALRLLSSEAAEAEVVLTDLHMPGIDGFEVLAVVRLCRPEIGVIGMSGHHAGWPAIAGDPISELLADVPLLRKPFSPASVVSEVGRILADARELRAGARLTQRRAGERRSVASSARHSASFLSDRAREIAADSADLVAAARQLRALRPPRPAPPGSDPIDQVVT